MLVRMCSNNLDTQLEILKSKKCRKNNLCDQLTCCVEFFDSAYNGNVLNLYNSVTKTSMVFKSGPRKFFTIDRNVRNELFLIFVLIVERCINFLNLSPRNTESLNPWYD